MIRFVPRALIMLVVFGLAIMMSRLATKAGLVSDDAVTLWVGAITAGDGQMPIGRLIAAYPTIPFLTTSFLEFITPRGTPTPVFLTAAMLALFAGAWLASFRRAGMPLMTAAAMTLLLALHPALLRASIGGPADMFLAAFLGMLGLALYDLRARSSAPEVMAVALSLLGLAFSHPMGAAIACAAIPLLVFAVRPELLASSVLNLVIALVFPTVFCVVAFVYMSWVFPGSGWSFLVAPAEGLATWAAGFSQIFGGGLTGFLGLDAVIAVFIALMVAAPLIPVTIAWVYQRQPLVTPAIVLIAMTVASVWITVTSGLFGDPAAIAVLSPILAAIMIARVPVLRVRSVVALLVMGWFGGIIALAAIDPRGANNVRAALEGRNVNQERIAAIGLGSATSGRDGILVDTFNAPAIVLGRGRARGLLSPSNDEFTLDVLFSKIDTPFVAVPDPQIGSGFQDRLNKAFPLLYRLGAPGYHLVYDKADWRMFAKN